MAATVTTNTENAPTRPCPSWCGVNHQGEDPTTSHQMHRDTGDDQRSYVTLYMTDYGTRCPALEELNGKVTIHFHDRDPTKKGIIRPVSEAEQLAETAEVLGRGDVAKIIREFSEVAEKEATMQAQAQED